MPAVYEHYHVLLATAETKWALINYATGQPTRVPREIAESFQAVE